MKKKFFLYLIYILIFFTLILWILDYNFSKKQFTFLKIKKLISKDNIAFLKKNASSFIDFNFEVSKKDVFKLENKIVGFEKFSNKFLKYRYYLEQDKKNIYLITNRGELFYFPKETILSKKNFELKKIKTNIEKVIGKDHLIDKNLVIKEILLINKEIYVSYINNDNECFSNAILKGNLDLKKIFFSKFVKLDECKKRYNLSQGGNIKEFKDNKIVFTVGDYEAYESSLDNTNEAQEINSYYGKILQVDLKSKKIDILSMGHRNPQGIFYDFENDFLFSTEHGPQGGDEVNININPNKNELKNFGWPISSYGEHYGEEQGWSEKVKLNQNLLNENKLYRRAPLYKSHKDYGFIEPIRYFTPSIGITEILKVNNSSGQDHKLLVASMGYDKEEDDMTLHILKFDKDFKETKYEKIYIGERIRDIIDLDNGSILMTIESSGSIALLSNIY